MKKIVLKTIKRQRILWLCRSVRLGCAAALVCLLNSSSFSKPVDQWGRLNKMVEQEMKDYSDQAETKRPPYKLYAGNYAWQERHNLNALLDMYEISGQIHFLDQAKKRISNMFANLDTNREPGIVSYVAGANSRWKTAGIRPDRAYPVWQSFHSFTAGDSIQGHLITAYILTPMARYCHLCDHYPVNDAHQKYARGITDSILTIINHLDSWALQRDRSRFYYIDYPGAAVTAWNYMAQAALVHFYLGQSSHLTAEKRHHHRQIARSLAQDFKSQLEIKDGAYIWRYYPQERPFRSDPNEQFWIEDVSHASAEIEMVHTFYRYGQVFTDEDITLFLNTLEKNLINADGSVNAYVDGFAGYVDAKRPPFEWRKYPPDFNQIRSALAEWGVLIALNPLDYRPTLLDSFYRIAETETSKRWIGPADIRFLASLCRILMPKNLALLQDAQKHLDPPGWTSSGLSASQTGRFNDRSCLMIEKTTQDQVGELGQWFPVLPNQTYQMTAQIFVEPDSSSKATDVQIGVYAPGSADAIASRSARRAGRWNRVRFRFVADCETREASVKFMANRDFAGRAYISNLQFFVIPQSVDLPERLE
ncbi:hypothetical protein JW992_06880 [candidate division KSB1 bacterium]|nr:hypothetical protein [candidate division KSB1 bacterium]